MSIVTDAVDLLEDKISGSGCDDGVVVLTAIDPVKCGCCDGALGAKEDADSLSGLSSLRGCPFESGIILQSSYGGKVCEMTTNTPITAKTRVSDMYSQPLKSPILRAAACAVMNAVSRFMCFSRISHACEEGVEFECIQKLAEIIDNRKVGLIGNYSTLPKMLEDAGCNVVSLDDAEVVLVSGDALCNKEMLLRVESILKSSAMSDISEKSDDTALKNVIFTGVSTSGICSIAGYEHFCPYGRR